MDPKNFVKRAMQNARGDDLERAERAFRGLSAKEMAEQHGQSGRTRQEVLDGYTAHRTAWNNAMAWLDQVSK